MNDVSSKSSFNWIKSQVNEVPSEWRPSLLCLITNNRRLQSTEYRRFYTSFGLFQLNLGIWWYNDYHTMVTTEYRVQAILHHLRSLSNKSRRMVVQRLPYICLNVGKELNERLIKWIDFFRKTASWHNRITIIHRKAITWAPDELRSLFVYPRFCFESLYSFHLFVLSFIRF